MPRNFGGMRGEEDGLEPVEITVRAVIIAFIIGIIVGALLHSAGILNAHIGW